jgi:hypothetical protein
MSVSDSHRRGIPWALLDRLGRGVACDEELDAVLPLLRGEPVEAPSWFIARAARIAREHAPAPARPSLLARVVATLVFDGRLQPQLAGVRGGAGLSRHLVYTAGPLTAHLEVREDRGSLLLAGQLLAEKGPQRFEVELFPESSGQHSAAASSNDLGYFVLHGVEPASYTLVVYGDEEAFEISPLVL